MLGRLFRRRRREPAAPVPVVLYTRADCPLCDEAREAMARARTRVPWRLEVRDVDADPELVRRHGESVPVVEVAGRVASTGWLEPHDFAEALDRAAREAGRAS